MSITEEEFAEGMLEHTNRAAITSVKKIISFVEQSIGVSSFELSALDGADIISTALMLRLQIMMLLADQGSDQQIPIQLSISGKNVFFSSHLVGKCLIVRAAHEVGKWFAFVEIPIENF